MSISADSRTGMSLSGHFSKKYEPSLRQIRLYTNKPILLPFAAFCVMKPKKISLEEVRHLHFAHDDVLTSFEERFERDHKLKTAMAMTYTDHEAVKIVVRLVNGELVELYSTLIEFEDNYVEISGGIDIPLSAIVDIDV
jgi:hypothetical protein